MLSAASGPSNRLTLVGGSGAPPESDFEQTERRHRSVAGAPSSGLGISADHDYFPG
jgi:hypothetical protein